MEIKFNLSEKIKVECLALPLGKQVENIRKSDVKEFINRLKEEIDDTDWFNKRDIYCVWKIIDKLAGDKLI